MIILYTIGCVNCDKLEERLRKNNIDFDISRDVDRLIEMGYKNAPILQINDNYYEFVDAMKMLGKLEQGKGVLE